MLSAICSEFCFRMDCPSVAPRTRSEGPTMQVRHPLACSNSEYSLSTDHSLSARVQCRQRLHHGGARRTPLACDGPHTRGRYTPTLPVRRSEGNDRHDEASPRTQRVRSPLATFKLLPCSDLCCRADRLLLAPARISPPWCGTKKMVGFCTTTYGYVTPSHVVFSAHSLDSLPAHSLDSTDHSLRARVQTTPIVLGEVGHVREWLRNQNAQVALFLSDLPRPPHSIDVFV